MLRWFRSSADVQKPVSAIGECCGWNDYLWVEPQGKQADAVPELDPKLRDIDAVDRPKLLERSWLDRYWNCRTNFITIHEEVSEQREEIR